jgi:benzoyl-CoA reductase subunit B
MLPVGLFGAGATIEIDHADSRIQSFVCSIARSTLELGLTQRLKDFDAMVFTSICDVARNLSGVWQANFPHQLVEYIHFLQNLSSTAAAEHYAQELRRMLGRLKKLGGVKVTDEQLRRSIAAYNRHRTLCAELYALRQTAPWLLSTSEAYVLLRIGTLLPVEEHTRLLEELLPLIQERARPQRDYIRVVLEGSFCEQPPLALLQVIEAAGCFIVNDDLLLHTRWFHEPVPTQGDPLRALAESYVRCSVSSSVRHDGGKPRKKQLLEKVRASHAEGIIFAAAKFCEPALLDYVVMKDEVEKQGGPVPRFRIRGEDERVRVHPHTGRNVRGIGNVFFVGKFAGRECPPTKQGVGAAGGDNIRGAKIQSLTDPGPGIRARQTCNEAKLMSEDKCKYQGVGRDLQKQLLNAWYQRLQTANADGRKVAYLFVPGNIAELLRVFDFELVYPEVNALQCGVRKISGDLILKAEDVGYSPDVCGYVKNDIGMMLAGNIGPSGTQLPKPDLLLCTYCGCTTFIKWFEALSHYYNVPLVMLDVPYLRTGKIEEADRNYVVAQLQELVKVCQKITGRKYDHDKLVEITKYSVAAEDQWVKLLHTAKHRPSPFDAYFEAVFFMAPIYVLRGTPQCTDYYTTLMLEIQERIERGIGPIPDEKFRVVIEGPPPWPHFRAFWELLKRWGVCAVASSYSKVGGFWDHGFRHDPARPLESIADYCLTCYTNLNLPRRTELLRHYAQEYQADAIVIHSVKSCRSFSVGQADIREQFAHKWNIPALLIESDLEDPRYFQEAQLRNRIDAFFESLEHQRLVKA